LSYTFSDTPTIEGIVTDPSLVWSIIEITTLIDGELWSYESVNLSLHELSDTVSNENISFFDEFSLILYYNDEDLFKRLQDANLQTGDLITVESDGTDYEVEIQSISVSATSTSITLADGLEDAEDINDSGEPLFLQLPSVSFLEPNKINIPFSSIDGQNYIDIFSILPNDRFWYRITLNGDSSNPTFTPKVTNAEFGLRNN